MPSNLKITVRAAQGGLPLSSEGSSASATDLKKGELSSEQDLASPGYQQLEEKEQPHYGIHYQRYALRTYLSLPLFLRPFVRLPGLRNFLVVARPTMDASGGLSAYRQAVPKSLRRTSPFLVVVDTPGTTPQDGKYSWIEFPLPDVFKLDLSGMTTFDDYLTSLKSRHRRAYRVRQQELAGSPLQFQYIPQLQPGSRALVDALWPLYLQNGERHGFHVLSRANFYRIHLSGHQGLGVLLVRDMSRGGEIVTFSTSVRSGDCLMSMWCGTDYANPLSRSCSTYINSQFEFVRIAIADPGIRWLDCGAQLRQMKTRLGCQGYPVSGYLRCKSRAMKSLAEKMMKAYFNPAKLLTDP